MEGTVGFQEDYSVLKDFTEKILYCNAGKRMRTILTKNQIVEKNILTALGFEIFSSLCSVQGSEELICAGAESKKVAERKKKKVKD